MQILIADDEPAILMALSALLDGAGGARIVTAASGAEALDQADSGDFRAILLDVNLGDANGVEVATQIRALDRHRSTPIVFLSGSDETARDPAVQALNCVSFLSKTTSPPALRAHVTELVGP